MTDEFYAPEYRRRRQMSMLVIGVAGMAMLAAALWLWDSVRGLDVRESVLRERIDTLAQREEGLAAQTQAHARALTDLSGAQGGMAQRLDVLYGARRAGLLAAEAEYLARLAAQRLALAHDAAGALTLLSAADSALREIRDADTHAARAAIAADSGRLQQIALLDSEAIYLRLAALPDQVDRISAQDVAPARSSPRVESNLSATVAEDVAALSWWQRLVNQLRTLVNVRRVDAPLTPLVTQGEKAIAAQNFRLLIGQAQLALLQRQGGIYQHSLVQAGEWLDRLAAGDPALRNAVRREISSLQTFAPDARLPDLTASLTATRTLAVRLMPEAGATP